MSEPAELIDNADREREPDSTDDAASDSNPARTNIIRGNLFRIRDGHGFRFAQQPPAANPEPVRRPAHVARMLAFAHRLQAAIDRGDYRDRADLARSLGLTRARITQLLDLTLLAPDIQEHILFLEAIDGTEPISERSLRSSTRIMSWHQQRLHW
ncbi:MAG: hypothetical protein MJE77_45170 [Proteobacteria bacterium]|nr:hypothetical protein [Pseudomonadota bacterium]